MNTAFQIFVKSKSFACKSAERFFKERKLSFQRVDLENKGISAGELDAVIRAVGHVDALFDKKSPLYDSLNVAYIKRSDEDKRRLLLDYPKLIACPIVRNLSARTATVGEQPEVWKKWL